MELNSDFIPSLLEFLVEIEFDFPSTLHTDLKIVLYLLTITIMRTNIISVIIKRKKIYSVDYRCIQLLLYYLHISFVNIIIIILITHFSAF